MCFRVLVECGIFSLLLSLSYPLPRIAICYDPFSLFVPCVYLFWYDETIRRENQEYLLNPFTLNLFWILFGGIVRKSCGLSVSNTGKLGSVDIQSGKVMGSVGSVKFKQMVFANAGWLMI